MSVSIYTITHVPFTPPDLPIYIPLQVGHAVHEDYGYLGDDTGENISDKNQYYSELTGLYWIWKNDFKSDFLGLCHYRRYFLTKDNRLMTEKDYLDILASYDVIVSRPHTGAYDYRTVYGRSHDIRNLDMTGDIIKELWPDYYETFQAVIHDTLCYVGNLFVAPRTLFCAYCQWLFPIFSVLEARIDMSSYDDYHRRVFGFLSEQLLIVWIKYNQLSYYEADFGVSHEKAETIYLKQEIQKYLYAEDIPGAYRIFCDTLEKRPDLLLPISDFDQELTAMEHILNICRIEQEAGLPTLLQFSRKQEILIRQFRLILKILSKIQDNTVTEEELQYLTDCKISCQAVVYMLQNFKQFANPLLLLNQLAVIYGSTGNYLSALTFLEQALTINEADHTTLSNIAAILQTIGQTEMAEEYQALLSQSAPKRIVVFTGGQIPVLNYIAEQYAVAIEVLGHTVFRFDKSAFAESFEKMILFQQSGLDAAIVLNNSCFQMITTAGESIWDLWNVPCYNIIVDHPMYFSDTLDHAPRNGIVVCSDRYHTDYIRRFYPTVARTFFLPTAGKCLKPYDALKPFAERSIDVLFIGSYKFDSTYIYDDVDLLTAEEMIKHPFMTFESILEKCLSTAQPSLSCETLKANIQQRCTVDKNTCALFRAEILRVLLEAGIRITVYGNNFENTDLCSYPNFIYKGCCSVEEGIRLMEDSKIVLNQLAWFKAGSSERIYEAILQGAVALSDDSQYLLETFEDTVDIRYYSLQHLEELPAIVHSILSDETTTEALRKNAYQKACKQHTWLQRAAALLDDLPS